MTSVNDKEFKKSVANKVVETSDGCIKGSKAFQVLNGFNYEIVIKSSGKVNIIDKAAGAPVFRLDKAHAGANYNHININPKISKLPNDPHIPLPPGGLTAGKGVATFCKYANKVNKVAIPLAIAIDSARVGFSVYGDFNNGTTRNTVEIVASVGGGWLGGFGGAAGGAALGTAILPGIGTIIGGIVGGLGGGIGGSLGSSAAAEAIGDALYYDVEVWLCKNCKREFKVRKYKGEKNRLCQECSRDLSGDSDALMACVPADDK